MKNGVTAAYEAPLGALPMSGEWTVTNLTALPHDGRRFELFDGVLVVSPVPLPLHQRAVGAIFRLLQRTCPPELEVVVARVDFQPTRRRSFQPDVMVVHRADVKRDESLRKPPVLAVEVLSDSTRTLDQVFKRAMYASSAVELFWIFDPRWTEFIAYERLGDDDYVEVAEASGDERIRLDRPFPVEICPEEILKG